MPITATIQKRARKSIAPVRPPIIPPPSVNASIDGTVCYLCGYLGRTRSLSIEKNGYSFLRHLPPAPGALAINDSTHSIRACHLCGLLLDKQRELNHTANNFFFKGFYRSTGSCHNNNELPTKCSVNPTDEHEPAPDKEIAHELLPPCLSPELTVAEIEERTSTPSRSVPPPLRKTTSVATNFPLDPPRSNELPSLDSLSATIHSRFLADYTAVMSSSKQTTYNSCHLCLSIKPHGTLYTIFKTQFEFLSSSQTDVCTLCYYNLLDQHKTEAKAYRRPRPQCYLCRCRINFVDWEVKLLETEHFPFLLTLAQENRTLQEQLYDNQRLVLTCDSCFYALLFQYLEQQRQGVPIPHRTYSWQCTSSYETEHAMENDEWLYSSNNITH